ncbi:MAG TPA: hypothetical protein VK787_11790 [Puia sp.]|jgi:hypothetical protein|nr:hypothetical protein [Puia sp.]
MRFTIIFLLTFFYLRSYAQEFGGNPPSLKWRQINSDTARIIFPVGMEKQAQQVASIVYALNRNTVPTIGSVKKKVNIVFQNQTTISNGYVALAPFRSEFQLTPEQNSFDLGSLPWHEQLAIHEYRHVEQYNNFRVGLSKAFYYVFGESGQAFANSLALPNWFWEGDAVFQETLVSKQGRGRLPYFFDGYRSLWAGNKNYSFLKLRNGSLRDFVPDHYPLGYMLVAYGREKFGDDFWRKVTHDAAVFSELFYPLQTAIKKYSGVSFAQFRNDALNYFSQQVKKDIQTDSSAIYAREHKHFVASEEFPQWIDDTHIVMVSSSYKKNHAFILYNVITGKKEVIKTRAPSLDNYFSYRNNKIVYAAYEPDLRWNWRDYSVIRLLDLKSKTDKKITSRTKYFAPDISEDGRRIVAVNVTVNGESQLHILNSETGVIESTIQNKDELFYTYPKFYDDKHVVSAVRNQQGEMALSIFNINDGTADHITPFSMNVIGFPSIQHDTIYFSASHNGYDRLYAFAKNNLFEITFPFANSSTGNYALQSVNGKYAFENFTAVGYKMNIENLSAAAFTKISNDEWTNAPSLEGIDALERKSADLLNKISFQSYPISHYSQSFHLLNIHSLRPYVNDPDYSFSLVSENVLNTLESELFFDYNRNEGYKQIGVDATYAQLFPWIDAGANYIFDRNQLSLQRNKKIYWNESQINAGLSVPLNFASGTNLTTLQFGSDIVYDQRYFQGAYKDSFDSRGFAYVDPFLVFTNQVQQPQMQIYPRFAQTLTVNYNRAVSTFHGNQFLASAYIYLPGIFLTNNLVLAAAFQQHDSLHQVSFSDNFPFSRGYSAENFYQLYRFSANYHFPLAYPDWGFGGIVYFLRVRANVFYDYTHALDFFSTGNKFLQQYRSFGTEIFFDTKWWNELPVSFGIRYSHLLDPDVEGRGPNQWELILPINLLSK